MIQSFSDIITNSSSEVFVIESKDHERIKTFLADVCEVFGWDVNDLMTFESVEEDGEVEGWDSTYKAGNLLIWSTDDNSIPSIIMEIISDMKWDYIPALEDIVISDVTREHLG
jgi:hypothetical protein